MINEKENPLFGAVNVLAFLLLCAVIVLVGESVAIIPVAAIGFAGFGALVQRGGKFDWGVVVGFGLIGFVGSLLWFFFGI